MRASVDLPEPDSPTTPRLRPACTAQAHAAQRIDRRRGREQAFARQGVAACHVVQREQRRSRRPCMARIMPHAQGEGAPMVALPRVATGHAYVPHMFVSPGAVAAPRRYGGKRGGNMWENVPRGGYGPAAGLKGCGSFIHERTQAMKTSTMKSLRLTALALATAMLFGCGGSDGTSGAAGTAQGASTVAVSETRERAARERVGQLRLGQRADRARADAVHLLGQRHRRRRRGQDDQRHADAEDRTGRRRHRSRGPADPDHGRRADHHPRRHRGPGRRRCARNSRPSSANCAPPTVPTSR